ncbi:tungstate/molybdate transport system ATP-binding protein [Pelobacter propionicus DSM 2379]|uniref:Tungstate/molybdate transport system ATP-binding protein n=2 Tax=Pelobacter propionicus TaxID=29543 RepID=A1AMF1_PELPD|nr:tungstate/molybdate transport system ATP-binding protein [Pelobacter propionicus DSM 2379]
MNDQDVLMEVRDIRVVRGGTQVLKVPSFTLGCNETVALIGPNGTGKSTFLLTLAGLLPLASGEIVFKQQAVIPGYASTAYRRRLAMVFQDPLLFDTTVFENVAAGLKLRRLPKQEIRERVTACLDRFRIAHLATRSASKLSGGEAQRTSLARAFAIAPEAILLDEPFAALDAPARQALSDDLEQVLHESRISAIMTTHDQAEALRLADRMVVMQQGEIIQNGTPTEVLSAPANEFVASFVGMENIFSGAVRDVGQDMFSLAVGDHAIQVLGAAKRGESAVICIHPESVTVSLDDPDSTSSARNILPARVSKVVHMGLFAKIYLDCGFKLVASITNQSLERLALAPDKRVFASFKATSVHLFRKG